MSKRLSNLINMLGDQALLKELESTLKLKELIKKEIELRKYRGHESEETFKWSKLFGKRLEDILKEASG